MTSLVLAHLVNCIVDSVKILLFCKSSDSLLVLACTLLSKHSLFNVCLGVPNALAEKLCKSCSMLSLFECISLECLSDFRIAFPVCLAAHCKVHSDLTALAVEMLAKTFNDFRINTFCNTKLMLVSPCESSFGCYDFFEFVSLYVTYRALCRSCITFVDVAAYFTSEFLSHS